MRPIFTIHAGEYLVGTMIEKKFRDLRVWIPSSDTGIDLLVTDQNQRRIVSLQVKFSKDYMSTTKSPAGRIDVVSGGWWKLNRAKLKQSMADYWVFVLYRPHDRGSDFVVVKPTELLARYEHGKEIQCYFTVVGKRKKRCFDLRGLSNEQKRGLLDGTEFDPRRDFTRFLNQWPFRRRGSVKSLTRS